MEQMLLWLADRFYELLGFPSQLQQPASLKQFNLAADGDNNPLMIQFFHWDAKGDKTRSWWRIFEDSLPELEKLGCTQVWLPPPNKAAHRDGRGYDAYDLWDLGEFSQKGTISTRWGTKAELLSAVKAAKARGIDVIIDAVLNHKMGADHSEMVRAVEVDPNNRNQAIGKEKEIESWSKFNYTGRRNKYSKLKWNSDHFTGIDWDHRSRKNGIFRFTGPGKHDGWNPNVDCSELGNYDYLLGESLSDCTFCSTDYFEGVDIDHRHPEVQQDMKAWGAWVVQETGAYGGFRLDAIKHMDSQFICEYLRYARTTLERPDLFAVGEYWTPNANYLVERMKQFHGELAFFDVPLHQTFHDASKAGSSFDMRHLMTNSLLQKTPNDSVTFVDNHDTVIGQSLESWVGPKFKPLAYALILLRGGGHPCVFYNDLYIPDEPAVASTLRKLMLARKYLAYGKTRDICSDDSCIAWARDGDNGHPHGCVVILNNGAGPRELRVSLPSERANSEYVDVIHPSHSGRVDAHGFCTMSCPAESVAVWTPNASVATLLGSIRVQS